MLSQSFAHRLARWFFPLFVGGFFLCPCRGFVDLLKPAEASSVSCCENCEREKQNHRVPPGNGQDCKCATGCCSHYLVPESGDYSHPTPPPQEVPPFLGSSSESPILALCVEGGVPLRFLPLFHRGSLLPALNALLI